jgi:hypothetical protein
VFFRNVGDIGGRAHIESDDDRIRDFRQCDVSFRDGANRAMDDVDPYFRSRQFLQRLFHRFDTALDVALTIRLRSSTSPAYIFENRDSSDIRELWRNPCSRCF